MIKPTEAFSDAILTNHVGVVGKTGSGKTSTAKLAVEQIAAAGGRVCVLDPIKSDWWGLTSTADGKHAGLPFRILGGPRAHVPLNAGAGRAIGELVASGKLPLSIIDMADFMPGELQEFFIDFAQSLIRHKKGVLHLVMEEAHLFAPKDRAGFGEENKAIHYASKLGTAGRSLGIRLIACTQRTQKLHNDILGSCETIIAHRLTAPADQKPIVDWLKANVDADKAKEIAASLSSLKTGEAWLCSGEARILERRIFPSIQTFDNSRTPGASDAAAEVMTAAVDIEELKTALADAVKEARENDPKQLRKRIAELEREIADGRAETLGTLERRIERMSHELDAANMRSIQAEKVGSHNGRLAERACIASWIESRKFDDPDPPPTLNGMQQALEREAPRREAMLGTDSAGRQTVPSEQPDRGRPLPAPSVVDSERAPAPRAIHERRAAPGGHPSGAAGILHERRASASQQKVLDSIAWWRDLGIAEPTRVQVANVAGYTPGGGRWRDLLSECRTAGWIDYSGDALVFTPSFGYTPGRRPSVAEMHRIITERLTNSQRKLFGVLLSHHGREVSRTQVAELAGYEAAGGRFRDLCSELSSLGLARYPKRTTIAAAAWLFPEGGQ